MAITQYGTNKEINPNYQPIRGILTGLGFDNSQIGYNPNTKNVMLNGQELDSSGYTGGSDQHYYADPNFVKSQLSALGVQPKTYLSPYTNQQNNITNQLVDRVSNRPAYNPNTDSALKLAQGQATQNVMESMNSRGILNSTVTADHAAQEVANLVPQYEQQYYQRYNDETNRLMQLGNYINSLDQNSYQIYKDNLSRKAEEAQMQFQKEQAAINNQLKVIDNAWARVKNLGYVDNDASIVLGVQVGTPSYEAQKEANDQKFRLQQLAQEQANRMQQMGAEFANQKALIDYRESSENNPNSINYKYKQAQIENMQSKANGGGFNLDDYKSVIRSMQNAKVKDDTGEYVQKYSEDDILKYIYNLGLTDDKSKELFKIAGIVGGN